MTSKLKMVKASKNDFTLNDVLTRKTLINMTSPQYFQRGENYFIEERVEDLVEYKGKIIAEVSGTYDYRVELIVKGVELDYFCSCPLGADGEFCKHCVATGLEWLSQQEPEKARLPKQSKPKVTLDNVEEFLLRQSKKDLVKTLMEQVVGDSRLREKLLLRAAKETKDGIDIDLFRDTIDRVVYIHDFVDYHYAYNYARDIDKLVDSIEETLAEGLAKEVVELTEYALNKIDDNYQLMDDSDGYLTEILERLQDLHFDACNESKPDPKDLAKRLFYSDLNSDLEIFYRAAERYSEILRDEGLAVYRELAEKEWSKVPVLKPGEKRDSFGRHYGITSIMESLAQLTGDIEKIVEIKKRDLSYAYSFLKIAEIYKNANNQSKAVEWAEKGIKAFPKKTDSRLRKFLAEEYHLLKRYNDEMKLIWDNFTDCPAISTYEDLIYHAKRIKQQDEWREKALAHIRNENKIGGKSSIYSRYYQNDRSLLVEIFLLEKDIELAWQEAIKGECSSGLWLELADKRKKNHPEDAILVYKKHVEFLICRKNNQSYEDAIRYMRIINKLMTPKDRVNRFPKYVETIRLSHKPKRNMMKLLNSENWK